HIVNTSITRSAHTTPRTWYAGPLATDCSIETTPKRPSSPDKDSEVRKQRQAHRWCMCELLVETRVALTKVREVGQHPLRERLTMARAGLYGALSREPERFDRAVGDAIAIGEDALRPRRAPPLPFGR